LSKVDKASTVCTDTAHQLQWYFKVLKLLQGI